MLIIPMQKQNDRNYSMSTVHVPACAFVLLYYVLLLSMGLSVCLYTHHLIVAD